MWIHRCGYLCVLGLITCVQLTFSILPKCPPLIPEFPCIKRIWFGISLLFTNIQKCIPWSCPRHHSVSNIFCQSIHNYNNEFKLSTTWEKFKFQSCVLNHFLCIDKLNSVICSFDWTYIYFCSFTIVLFLHYLYIQIISILKQRLRDMEQFVNTTVQSLGKKVCQFISFKDKIGFIWRTWF